MGEGNEPRLATKVTFDFADGDIVTTVEVAEGAAHGGWGISRIEVRSRMPVTAAFLPNFLQAIGDVILSGGIPDLLARHEAES